MMPMLRDAKHAMDVSEQARAEREALRLMALAGGRGAALRGAEMRGNVSPRVIAVLRGASPLTKAAAPAGTTASAADIAGVNASAFSAFEAALRTTSVFDAVRAEAMEVPFYTRVGMMTGQITGGKIGEGAAKVSQTMFFAANTLTPEKLVSLIAVSKEFLDALPTAMESLTTQLRVAVGSAADLEFLTDIAATNSDASSGLGTSSLSDIMADFQQLLGMVDYNQASRLWAVVSPAAASAMVFASLGAGLTGMTPLGGQFFGLRVFVSDSLPAVTTIVLIDSTGLAVAASPVEVRASDETTLELATSSSMTSATGTGASVTSMFQTNSVSLMAERSIAFAPLRPNAFASVTNIGWAASADSPLP